MRSIVPLDAYPPHSGQGAKKAECGPPLILPFDRVAVSGVWENEDQKLAKVRFGFRALTRTPVAFQEASLTGRDLSPSYRLLLLAVAPLCPSAGRSLEALKKSALIVMAAGSLTSVCRLRW